VRRFLGVVVVVVVAAILPVGCGTRQQGASGDNASLTVLAAASLTEAFTRIVDDFQAANHVVAHLSFGPSDGLAQQIQAGAPADVFASASPAWMDAVQGDPGVEDRVDFARNRLVIVTPSDDPAQIRSLDDLARPGLKVVLAAAGVPAGDYARQMLDHAGIAERALANVVSNEEDVKGVVQKVALGEADAGIVYVTDVTPAIRDDVREVAIPDAANVVARYPIAVVATSEHRSLASMFVSFVAGPTGQRILASFGFLPPA
jgi:molybdate transport system substrate-binding protein